MNKTRPILIFTDLDGTLLDHDSADWAAASRALVLAQQRGIPVIPASSRSFEECLYYQQKMQLRGPIIFENGAGVALPCSQFRQPLLPPSEEKDDFWICRVAQPYSQVRSVLQTLRQSKHYQFRGFGDMSDLQIMEATGWEFSVAQEAKKRRHSEVLFWLDNAKSFDQFAKDLEKSSLKLSRGTHFIHVGSTCDKGQATRWLISLYQKLLGGKPYSVALGDSANDLAMLESTDCAIVIRPPHTIPLAFRPSPSQTHFVSEAIGPSGWARSILRILDVANVPA